MQVPYGHLLGSGCPKCTHKKRSEEIRYGALHPMSYSKWGEMGRISKHFDSFKMYITVCNSDNESFLKIGKTFRTMHKRFDDIPYKYDVHNKKKK